MHNSELFSVQRFELHYCYNYRTSRNLARVKLKGKSKSAQVKTSEMVVLLKRDECNLMQHEPFPPLLDPAFIENPKCHFRNQRRSVLFRNLNPFLSFSRFLFLFRINRCYILQCKCHITINFVSLDFMY